VDNQPEVPLSAFSAAAMDASQTDSRAVLLQAKSVMKSNQPREIHQGMLDSIRK